MFGAVLLFCDLFGLLFVLSCLLLVVWVHITDFAVWLVFCLFCCFGVRVCFMGFVFDIGLCFGLLVFVFALVYLCLFVFVWLAFNAWFLRILV